MSLEIFMRTLLKKICIFFIFYCNILIQNKKCVYPLKDFVYNLKKKLSVYP